MKPEETKRNSLVLASVFLLVLNIFFLYFRTYKKVELYPSSSLNLIIGPNGTGKSTFVCAIILGLCGKTSVIGRAKKVSAFYSLRHNIRHSEFVTAIYYSIIPL